MIQCCRRYKDLWMDKDLLNALKYVTAIAAVFASAWASIDDRVASLVIWIMLGILSAAYSYYWDLANDWKVRANDKIIPKRYLTVASVINLILRFNWMLTISTFILFNQLFVACIFGCLEVGRRYMWALFRMELEHTHNVEHFRATKDIPLLEE